MIYCVVPQALAGELYDKLVAYYADDPNVTVIIDRRSPGGPEAKGSGAPADREAPARRERDRPARPNPADPSSVDSGDK
ncbi:MAG TPA: hypothetical protein VGY97_00495 [Solirubrobacteraceae bacterium]|jgi:hypothetical protein|nr:hypothetical protein [Solirubrobacteraceae bacterium]